MSKTMIISPVGKFIQSFSPKMAFDDRWITVKPNGPDAKGRPALIGEGGEIKAGMGGKFNGQKINEIPRTFETEKYKDVNSGKSSPARSSKELEVERANLKRQINAVSNNARRLEHEGTQEQAKNEWDKLAELSQKEYELGQKIVSATKAESEALKQKERDELFATPESMEKGLREIDQIIASGKYLDGPQYRLSSEEMANAKKTRNEIVEKLGYDPVIKEKESSAQKQKDISLSEKPQRPEWLEKAWAEKGNGQGWNGKIYSGNRVYINGKEHKLTDTQVSEMKEHNAKYAAWKKAETTNPNNTYLNVPYENRREASAAGAHWSEAKGKWYISEGKEVPESLKQFLSGGERQLQPLASPAVNRTEMSKMSVRDIEKEARHYDNIMNEGHKGGGYNPYRSEIERRYDIAFVRDTDKEALSSLGEKSKNINGAEEIRAAYARNATPEEIQVIKNSSPEFKEYKKWKNASAGTSVGFAQIKAAEAIEQGKPFAEAQKIADEGIRKAMMYDSALALDRASVRHKDENGFLHVKTSHISKECVNPYYGREIPGWKELGLDPDKIYKGWRKGEELAKGAETFNGLPILKGHHAESADNPQKDHRVGSTGTDCAFDAPYLNNALSFTDADMIDDIEKERIIELSSAYRYDPVFTSGEFDGEPYDFIMTNIRGNHVAVVEEGRAGPDVVVADQSINPNPFKRKVKMGMEHFIDKLKGLLDLAEKAESEKDPEFQEAGKEILGDMEPIFSGEPETDAEDEDEDMMKHPWYAAASEEARDVFDKLNAKKDEELMAEIEARLGKGDPVDDELPIEIVEQMKAAGLDPENEGLAKAFMAGMKAIEKAEGEDCDMPGMKKKAGMDEEVVKEKEKEEIFTAQDAAIRIARASAQAENRAIAKMRSLHKAAGEVESLCGKLDPLAFDSAAGIYTHALKTVGTTPRTKDEAALRDMVGMAMDAKRMAITPLAVKSSGAKFEGQFAGLANIRRG